MQPVCAGKYSAAGAALLSGVPDNIGDIGVIVLATGRYLFRVWEDYHEASVGYQKLQKYVIEKSENQGKSEKTLLEIDFVGTNMNIEGAKDTKKENDGRSETVFGQSRGEIFDGDCPLSHNNGCNFVLILRLYLHEFHPISKFLTEEKGFSVAIQWRGKLPRRRGVKKLLILRLVVGGIPSGIKLGRHCEQYCPSFETFCLKLEFVHLLLSSNSLCIK